MIKVWAIVTEDLIVRMAIEKLGPVQGHWALGA